MLPNGLPEVFATCSISRPEKHCNAMFLERDGMHFYFLCSSFVTALLVSSLPEMCPPVLVLIFYVRMDAELTLRTLTVNIHTGSQFL